MILDCCTLLGMISWDSFAIQYNVTNFVCMFMCVYEHTCSCICVFVCVYVCVHVFLAFMKERYSQCVGKVLNHILNVSSAMVWIIF